MGYTEAATELLDEWWSLQRIDLRGADMELLSSMVSCGILAERLDKQIAFGSDPEDLISAYLKLLPRIEDFKKKLTLHLLRTSNPA